MNPNDRSWLNAVPQVWRDLASGALDALLQAAEQADLNTPGAIEQLRKHWPIHAVQAAAELIEARHRGRAKFGDNAAKMMLTRIGTEQASGQAIAQHKAQRIVDVLGNPAAVIDACCGIGGDSLGFAQAGLSVTPIDLNPLHAWMAEHNTGCAALCGDALQWTDSAPNTPAVLHADPDRRPGGRRTLNPEDFQPTLGELHQLMQRSFPNAAIKLAPGIDADQMPFDCELQYISQNHRLVQAIAWTGALQRAQVSATCLLPDADAYTLTGEPGFVDSCAPLQWLFTVDPSVERAELMNVLSHETGCASIHPALGLLTHDTRTEHPMLQAFELLTDMPWRRGKVKAELKRLDAGEVVVKTRGGAADPDRESKLLRGKGSQKLCVFVLRFDRQVRALITRRYASSV